MDPSTEGESLLACRRCVLAETRQCVVVGEGPIGAEVVVVGEAPGAEEDRLGRPFIGASGQILRRVWAEVAGGTPLYILNTVRCRPPENRRPLPEELAACRPWLEADLTRVAPRIILTLGRTATAALLPATARRADWRGWWKYPFGSEDRALVALWHPAAVLRARRTKLPLWTAELANIYRVLHGERPPHAREASVPAPG